MASENLTGWEKACEQSNKEIEFVIVKAGVRASGWSLGRSEDEINKEAARRLKEEKGIEYKLPGQR